MDLLNEKVPGVHQYQYGIYGKDDMLGLSKREYGENVLNPIIKNWRKNKVQL